MEGGGRVGGGGEVVSLLRKGGSRSGSGEGEGEGLEYKILWYPKFYYKDIWVLLNSWFKPINAQIFQQ